MAKTAKDATVDFDAVLTDQKGEPIQGDATLAILCANALFATFPDERDLSGEEKFKRGMLALRIQGGGKLLLTAEEIAKVKKLVAKAFGPLIVVQAWQMLDPAEQGDAK
jgi:hypothetical protein